MIVVKRIKRWFSPLKFKMGPYHDLTPIDDVSKGSEYFNALDCALSNKKISNVALTAPFGAGKSSIIESYLKNKDKEKYLRLSLSNFLANSDANINTPSRDYIEREFLKKLFYKVKASKIPQSRYRKLHKISTITIFIRLVQFMIACLIYMVLFNIIQLNDILHFLQRKSLFFEISLGWIFCGWLFFFVFATYVISVALNLILSKWKNWEISIFDKVKFSTDIDSEKSVFDRYLDEIVYFFERTRYEVVFIEDLDRFDAIVVFAKLRELNILLNSYDSIRRHITFVYAIRDDYFQSETDRTKFFDFIIPVIPYINVTNSNDILRRKIAEIKEAGIKVEISDEYITKVSLYIGDMRVLTNIVNEFVIYKKTVKTDESLSLDDEKFLSLMIFKNIYPKDFADIESERGAIKEAFYCKDNFISELSRNLKDEIENEENYISLHEQDILKDTWEIKQAMFQTIASNCIVDSITIGSSTKKKYSYGEIMNEEFNLEQFAQKKLTVIYYEHNSTYYPAVAKEIEISDIDKEYTKNGIGFIERWKAARKCQNEKKTQLQKDIEKKKRQVAKINGTRIRTLVNEYGVDEVFGESEIKNNHLLMFMLRNGYIDENYANYINYYHPDSITLNEHEFILNLRNFGGPKDYSLEIQHPARVVERIILCEFSQSEILNFSLVRYLFDEKTESEQTKEVVNLLKLRNHETKEFIKAYLVENNKPNEIQSICVFIEKMSVDNPNIWNDIASDETLSNDTQLEYFDLILSCSSIEAIKRMEKADNGITLFLLGRKNILKDLKNCTKDKIIEIIRTFDVKFSDVSFYGVDEDLINYIYQNNAYEINSVMVGELIKYLSPDLYEQSRKQNYTVIKQSNKQRLQEYVEQNIESYISKVVLSNNENNEETQQSIEELIRLVGYDVQIAKKIIDSQNVIFGSIGVLIQNISVNEDNKNNLKNIVDYLIEQDKLQINWTCILEYYQNFSITDVLLEKLKRDINRLCDEQAEIEQELLKALLLKNWTEVELRKLTQNYRLNEFDIPISSFNEDKLRILIDIKYIPFSVQNLEFIHGKYPNLISLLIKRYKIEVLNDIDAIPMKYLPFDEIIKSDEYTVEERWKILKKCPVANISAAIAYFITYHDGGIDDRRYVQRSLELIPNEHKIELLVNHLELFKDAELQVVFNQLSSEYHALAQRNRHKVFFEKNECNKRLLEKLEQRQYLTSQGEDFDENSNKPLLWGWVKGN